MSAELVLQGIATVIALGVAAQWVAWRFRLPSILLLLVFGFVARPVAGLFIVLSARLDLSVLAYVNAGSLLFLALLVLGVRPLAVWASSLGTPLDWREWAFLSWLAPRGIVAAAVASLFALRLEGLFPAGQVERIVPVVFLVIVGTAAIYGLTLAPVARALGLAQPNPQGVPILGGHAYARRIAEALDALGTDVLLIDADARHVEQAREEGLRAEQANALDERVFEELDLAGIGRLLAMTPNAETNALAALYFGEVFESAEVYQLAVHPERRRDRSTAKAELPRHLRGRPLFADNVTCSGLARRFDAGARLRLFDLTEERGLREIERHYEPDEETRQGMSDEYAHGEVVPLFVERDGDLLVLSPETDVVPRPGDGLVALVPPVPDGKDAWDAARTPEAVRRARVAGDDGKPPEAAAPGNASPSAAAPGGNAEPVPSADEQG